MALRGNAGLGQHAVESGRRLLRTALFRPPRRGVLALLMGAVIVPITRHAFAQDDTAEETLGLEPDNLIVPVTARYQSLSSYADEGTVETRYQWPGTPRLVERHRFETAYRAPRNFYFRFDADPASGGDAYVIWCDGGPFQSWWKATGVHTVHDNGQGAVAFLTGQSPTKDSANLVAPHLFPQAQLVGPSYRLIAPADEGAEAVEGHACHCIKADSRVTGVQTVDHRPTRVWIDTELGLVRKVYVAPEEGSSPDLVDEITYIIEPMADPELSDSRFSFTPPKT
jgi:hypothetical protein